MSGGKDRGPQFGVIRSVDALIQPLGEPTVFEAVKVSAVPLLAENLKLRAAIKAALKKIETAVENFNHMGSSPSRIENAKREMFVQTMVEEALVILKGGEIP